MAGGIGRMTGLGYETEICDTRGVFSTGVITRVSQRLLGHCNRAFLCLPAFLYNLLTVGSCPMLPYLYVVFVRFESYS